MPIYKSPLEQSQAIAPESTRSKWNRYFKHIGDGNPRTIDKYNRLIEEIEGELPFANEAEHQKWLDLSASWNGEQEWPKLTEKALKRIDDYSLEPSQIRELKEKFKGKDYDTAIDLLFQGAGFGDIINNGVIPYEGGK